MLNNMKTLTLICKAIYLLSAIFTCEGFVDITLQGSVGVGVKHVDQARDVLCCVRNDDCLKIQFHIWQMWEVKVRSLTLAMMAK